MLHRDRRNDAGPRPVRLRCLPPVRFSLVEPSVLTPAVPFPLTMGLEHQHAAEDLHDAEVEGAEIVGVDENEI